MLERCVGLHVGVCFFVLIFMLDFVLVCASTVLVCASTVLVCASTVLVCASTVLAQC